MRRRLAGENDISSTPAGSMFRLRDSVEGGNGSLVVEALKFRTDGREITLCAVSAE
jgi:hypothetical protein